MGKKAITVSTATRPAINDQNTEESFRVLEGRLQQLENLVSPGEQQASNYDDAFVRGQIRELRREIEEHNHRKQQSVSAGDSYASDFKATYSGSGADIAIATGYYLFPLRTQVSGSNVTISLTNGTHYIYLLLEQKSGTWYPSLVESTGYAYTQVDRIPYIIAQVDVVGGAIDEDTLIQHQFGEVQNAAGCREVRYRGDFAALQTATNLQVNVTAGRVVYGTGTTTVSGNKTIGGGAGVHYLYVELSYSGGIVSAIQESTSYPANTTTHERFVIAQIDIADSKITDVRQAHQGQYTSVRIYD